MNASKQSESNEIGNQEYIIRTNIDEELNKQLNANGNTINCVLISGPKNYGKTTIIKHALQNNKLSYIYLDFHNKPIE